MSVIDLVSIPPAFVSELSCGSFVVDSLFIVCSLPLFVLFVCVWSLFCYVVLHVLSSFTIISLRKREMIALLSVSTWWHMTVSALFLFLTVPWVGLQRLIEVLSCHTHFLLQTFICRWVVGHCIDLSVAVLDDLLVHQSAWCTYTATHHEPGSYDEEGVRQRCFKQLDWKVESVHDILIE